MSVITKGDRRLKRRRRVRAKVSGTAERPRISVFRSNQGISAQLIDDAAGRTLAAVNWYEPDLRKLRSPSAPSAPARRSPSEPRRRASPRPCSTVAATATTGTFARLPRRSARAA